MRRWQYTLAGDVEIARTVGSGVLTVGAHFHESVQVTAVTSGERAFRTRDGIVRAAAGRTIVIPALLPHAALPMAAGDDSVNLYLPPALFEDALGDVPVVVPVSGAPAAARRSELVAAVTDARDGLRELAGRFGMTRETLIRRFARETGMTPHAYRVVTRLNEARSLLRAGVAPAEVAARAGFADQSHLGRQFRAAFGATPGDYRITFVPDSGG
ncbi:hypothetical protein GCM10010168_63050 [Actinoplanes ianthinogenes]|uniref:HTH araC/xylS-type domain-containing protein n=1 Tax=Actinoplanes ianthinogenes TaxID=122358 RepID=A0ABM7LJL0_9ACTN|nr:AraC family transcriptional regulator [Actinoplanes ianthinogenes]BCJ39447.1 hypothetical protein Aiant_01040 [Actinoplanes ianthinogenes]GGR36035.1 hypothetical protein GCM10010168_63050 [Actinoplanes ianthinogenes]